MAQFDVHRNAGPSREGTPFVVVVQSSMFDGYRRRVVVPLARTRTLPSHSRTAGSRMHPVFHVKGVEVFLNPLDIVSAPVDQLGPKVASLAQAGQSITDALDELLTRSWG